MEADFNTIQKQHDYLNRRAQEGQAAIQMTVRSTGLQFHVTNLSTGARHESPVIDVTTFGQFKNALDQSIRNVL